MTTLSLLLMFAADASAQNALTLAMENTTPEPGESLSMEVRWTNVYGRPVQIPETWTDELKMWVFRVPPGEQLQPRQVSSAVEMSIIEARRMAWITVEPGEMVTHTLPIEIEECQDGCIGGSYYGQVNLSWGMVDGRRDNQVLPAAQVPFSFDVKLPLEELSAAAGVRATLEDVSVPTPEATISATVVIQNETGAPMWMPTPEHWQSGCSLMDKKGETITMNMVGSGSGALTEDGYQLVAAGEGLSVPVSCESMFEGKLPKKSGLTILVSPESPFFPVNRHDDRAVLTGMVPSGEPVVVPKK
jgi:hypothetical protein